jgi:hypothetical protein
MIVIILLIIIISFYLYLYFRSSGTIENFYTFYLPFYKKEVNKKIINMKQYNKPFFRNVFKNNIIKMGYIRDSGGREKHFMNLLSKLILSNSQYFNLELIEYDNNEGLINALNNNKVHYANCSSVSVNKFYEEKQNNFLKNQNKILYICNTYLNYIYLIVKKKTKIENIKSIGGKTKIGLRNIKSDIYILIKYILGFEKLVEGIDYEFVFDGSKDKLYKMINNDEIDILCLRDIYPSIDINTFIANNFLENYILLPVNDILSTIYEQNIFLRNKVVDLNDIPTFLPRSINNQYYYQYNPDFNMFGTEYYLLTNIYNDTEFIKDIMRIISDNTSLFNKLDEYKYDKLSKYSVGFHTKIIFLQFANKAKEYLYENGFFTETDNQNCKYLIGYERCTPQTLADNGLLQ